MSHAYLLPYCNNDRQRQTVAMLDKGMTMTAIAKELYKAEGANLRRTMRDIKRRAAAKGVSPEHDMTRPAPDGFVVKGTSTLYNAAGEISQQWVKTSIDWQAQAEVMRESLIATLEEFRGAGGRVAMPKVENKDTMHLIPIGDPHIGLYAWHKEAGEDFDTTIACRDLMRGVHMVLDSVPSCGECLIVNLGDYFHADNSENRTMRSGHALDVDSRYSRVIDLGNRLMLSIVDAARRKHKRVKVISLPGNHDDHSGIMLSSLLDIYYDKDPRVNVCKSASMVRYHKWGRNLLGFTHGHAIKPNALGEIMAHDKPQEWADTRYRYWHTGHIHSNNSMDCRGWRWESHRTLAAQDAWSAGAGYRSGRDIKGILYHAEFGEVNRTTVDIRAIANSLGVGRE